MNEYIYLGEIFQDFNHNYYYYYDKPEPFFAAGFEIFISPHEME